MCKGLEGKGSWPVGAEADGTQGGVEPSGSEVGDRVPSLCSPGEDFYQNSSGEARFSFCRSSVAGEPVVKLAVL